MTVEQKLVPPDGGWGWVIMIAYGVHNLIYIPLMQNFGLIFNETFDVMGLSATNAAVILTTNAAFGMSMGLFIGPLLRRYGYRKMSLVGAALLSFGFISTTICSRFSHYLITYGLITSVGIGIGMNSYPLAMNSYFSKRRNKATGYAYTITALGSIVMPQLITLLLVKYSVQGAALVIGGICLHTFVTAILLQPIKWHMKIEVEEAGRIESNTELIDNEINDIKENLSFGNEEMVASNFSLNETQSVYGFDTIPSFLATSSASINEGSRRRSMAENNSKETHRSSWASLRSINTIPLEANRDTETPEDCDKKNKKVLLRKRMLKPVVRFLDLSLLKDPIYVNIMLGMSIAIFAELNFSLLTPFILADLHFTIQQSATFLSILSVVDLIFRFISPFIGDYFKRSPRIMYMISLLMLIITRFSLVMVSSFEALIIVAVGLGVAKGVRTVYMMLVIPSYVPIERLASAAALQLAVNGILVLAGGPVLGAIRDVTGSYVKCIFVMNFVTFCTIVMWTIELVYLKFKNTKAIRDRVDLK